MTTLACSWMMCFDSVAGEVATDATKELTELEKYWKTVKENPSDFTGWTYLLQYVEQEGKVEEAREAFDSFLRKYPYCYGYWKKYADLERKNENIEKTVQIQLLRGF